MVYRKRIYGHATKSRMIVALRDCRDACIETTTQAPIGGDVYRGAHSVMTAIDDMAEVLTGDRRLFHLKGHSTHGGPR